MKCDFSCALMLKRKCNETDSSRVFNFNVCSLWKQFVLFLDFRCFREETKSTLGRIKQHYLKKMVVFNFEQKSVVPKNKSVRNFRRVSMFPSTSFRR